MFSYRWGLMAGAAAFIISFAVGLLTGVNIFSIILRAVIFLAVFFALGTGIRFLINSYIPELLFTDDEAGKQNTFEQPGSHVNITLDNTSGYAMPEMYRNSGNQDGIGNIGDLVSGVFKPGSQGIDQNEEDDYNEGREDGQSSFIGESFSFEKTPAERRSSSLPAFSPGFGNDTAGMGGLPDFEDMATVFSGGSGGASGPAQPESGEPERKPTGNKPQLLQGDFNPKELAEGIRTVLSKDK